MKENLCHGFRLDRASDDERKTVLSVSWLGRGCDIYIVLYSGRGS